MNYELRETLLGLIRQDEATRAELAADGSLFDGYHPRMESVHRENAAQLRRWQFEFLDDRINVFQGRPGRGRPGMGCGISRLAP